MKAEGTNKKIFFYAPFLAKGFLCSPHYFSTRYEKINVGWVGVFFQEESLHLGLLFFIKRMTPRFRVLKVLSIFLKQKHFGFRVKSNFLDFQFLKLMVLRFTWLIM
jgi:hypothetical protein